MKTIGELNNILRRELGDRDISYAWMRMDDTRLLTPMQQFQFVDNKSIPVFDYLCVCGKNVQIHKPGCKISVPQARWVMRYLQDPDKDRYCLAKSHRIEARNWTNVFPALPFPPGGILWMPHSNQEGLFLLDHGLTPTVEDTQYAIAAIREGRAVTFDQLQAYLSDQEEAKKQERFNTIFAELTEVSGISSEPGKKREKSFASVSN
jgi:hypothetical protein